jgi:hypothetical protein
MLAFAVTTFVLTAALGTGAPFVVSRSLKKESAIHADGSGGVGDSRGGQCLDNRVGPGSIA